MRRVLTPYVLMFFFLFLFNPISSQENTAENGEIDISSIADEAHWQISLDGQWEFYWGALLEPSDFSSGQIAAEREIITIPGNWNDVNNYPSHGFSTIRLIVEGLNRNKTYSLYIPEMLTSFRLFLNDREVYGNGTVGKKREETKPQFKPGIISFETLDGKAEIICQISNFDHRNSGIWRSLLLGTEQKVVGGQRGKQLLEMFIAAVLLTISIFHIGIYIYRSEAKAELLFGLTCLILFFRTISTGEQLLNQLIPAFPWGLARRMEYSPFFIVAPLFMSFISDLFPRETIKKVNHVFILLFSLLAAFFIFLPVRITNNAILIAELLLVAGIIYALFILVKALIAKREHSIAIMAAFIILVLTSINDILFSRQIIMTRYMAPFGFIFFIFLQSQMLSRRYARSFKEVTSLSHKLKDLNESLSRFVPFQFLDYLKKKSILDVRLGDQVLEDMTILFADIRSFTTLSEVMTPEENFKFLNSFLSQVVPVIRQQGGFVDKFIGDAIMALFPYPPDQAVRAALELQNAVKRYNEARNRAGYREISLGIGIHTGKLMLGTIGETNRMETTVIADTVNIASRLEELTKTYGARIIISRELFDKLEDKSGIISRSLGESTVKGKSYPLDIVEILDDNKKIDSLTDFEEAVDLIRKGDYNQASHLLDKIVKDNPEDKAALYFHEHCNNIKFDKD